jgi:hypothetical protein
MGNVRKNSKTAPSISRLTKLKSRLGVWSFGMSDLSPLLTARLPLTTTTTTEAFFYLREFFLSVKNDEAYIHTHCTKRS